MVVGFEYENTTYYFEKNAQGDIIRVFDQNGNALCEYIYDAWGNIVNILGDKEIANINPFRYRGYYQDKETGFYYLQSRYYDSETGRFINADTVIGYGDNILSYNLFTYCLNNCVNCIDPLGNEAIAINYFVAQYGLALSGKALVAKLTAYAIAAFPYLIIGIAAIVAVAVTAYAAYKVYMTSTKTLADVKLKQPSTNNKVYQFAYVTSSGALVRVYGKMTYAQAVAALSGSAMLNTMMKEHKGYWGIYASNQAYAKALAYAFGCTKKPEVHGDGYYGHYHDGNHKFHIWYGGIIRY